MISFSGFAEKNKVSAGLALADSMVEASRNVVTYLDTSSQFKTLCTKLEAGTVAIAQSLKISVQSVWDIVVKQQKVKVWFWFIGIVIMLGTWYPSIKFVSWCFNRSKECTGDANAWGLLGTGWLIGKVTLTALIYPKLFIVLVGFANPEYGAILEIVNFIK